MKMSEVVAAIEWEWIDPEGFLYRLRDRVLDIDGAKRLEGLLKSCVVPPGDAMIDRRLVSAIWFIPQFVEWNAAGFESDESQLLCKNYSNIFWNLVDQLLTLPDDEEVASSPNP
jgi:hypothetical protein